DYGDATAHTLAHLAESAGGLSLPTLESLGLGHVTAIRGVRSMAQPPHERLNVVPSPGFPSTTNATGHFT
ncbi:MAG TPA: hypothetical protein VF019_03670, partial [Nitrospira sp.]